MSTPPASELSWQLFEALAQGRVILLLGGNASLEAMAVTYIRAFDLRVALLAGKHGPLQEGLHEIGRPVHRLDLAGVGELDPNAVYLIEFGSLRHFRRRLRSEPSALPDALLALFRTHSVLILGMKPGDPWLETLASLWPEGRFPLPWFILRRRPLPDAAAWEDRNLFVLPPLEAWLTPGSDRRTVGTWDERIHSLLDLLRGCLDLIRPAYTVLEEKDVDVPSIPFPPLRKRLSKSAPPRQVTDFEFSDERNKERLQPQTLRIDAAAPTEVVVGDPFVLAVSVRRPESPPLREEDLTLLKSGEARVVFPETGPIKLRLQVSAPECSFDGPNDIAFRLFPDADSPVFYFHLVPRSVGLISIVIRLFQEDEWLGGVRLQTRAGAALAGAVTMTVTSRPLVEPADETIRERVAELKQRWQKAKRFLELLENQAAAMAPGVQRAEVQLQIEEQRALIAAIEQELDALLIPA
jgi:hypothetical protein